ncbi:MAG: FAD-dependent oxidoreductase [Thermonemataceae bacterium]|nr:FAD-dependent oxidoreductase [Thermonemataceae bacterium]
MLSFWEKESFVKYDYIVVGSGLVGLSAAAALTEKRPKKRVLVVERGVFPSGASTKNAGFACFGNLTELLEDIENIGEQATLELVEKRWKGLQILRKRLSDKQSGFVATGSHELILDKIDNILPKINYLNQLLKPIFQKNVFHLKENAAIAHFRFDTNTVKNLVFNELEGQLHTGKLINNLLDLLQRKGVRFLNHTSVNEVREFGNKVEVLINNQIVLQAEKVIIANNAFASQLFAELPLKAGRGQVLLTSPIKNLAIKGNFHFDKGFYYFRNIGKNQVLFGGGRNFDLESETTTQMLTTEKIMDNLKEKLRTIILPKQNFEIEQTWAGIMGFTPDRKPILKMHSPRIAIGVGMNGMGVAVGSEVGNTLASMIEN